MNNLRLEINRKYAEDSSHYFSGTFRRGKIIGGTNIPSVLKTEGLSLFLPYSGQRLFSNPAHSREGEK